MTNATTCTVHRHLVEIVDLLPIASRIDLSAFEITSPSPRACKSIEVSFDVFIFNFDQCFDTSNPGIQD